MSSRALRKLQKEREQQTQLDIVDQHDAEGGESGEDDLPGPKARNAFDMLNEGGEEEGSEAEAKSDHDSEAHNTDSDMVQHKDKSVPPERVNAKTKTKKKKNKKKGKSTEQAGASAKGSAARDKSQLDEIDLALESLSTKPTDDLIDPLESTRMAFEEANLYLYSLLAVESKHLNALNEMKRLFGSVVTENEEEAAGTPRRRGRGAQQLDLGGALAGRNSPASRGQGLAGLALRRNPFILGKEEWPKATSGGLGMELVEKMTDGTIEYRFVHNTIYQDVQRQFETCVESLDPQRIISLLQYNPYHISTLLQVSEIAKQQGDHSVSGDLLERALFSFGRSVQSSFTTALSQGKARLDFRRPENREFWLAAWRYTNNLGQRGTWRTAYEWARLILSLDPEGDPYCISLVLDQIALRGGQSEHFLKLADCSFFRDYLWLPRINIRISSALAEYKLKQAPQSRASLTQCVIAYPWMFARLLKELNIDHVPKAIWGTTPKSERDQFECELYVHNAKDLWNTPEAISFLVEVVEAADTSLAGAGSKEGDSITLDEARHVLLSGVPTLINLVPRRFTSMPSSSSDPLPPSNNLLSYNPAAPTDSHPVYASPFENAEGFETPSDEGTPNPRSPEDHEHERGQEQELQGRAGFFRRLLRAVAGSTQGPNDTAQVGDMLENVQRQAADQGVPPELAAQQADQFMDDLERHVGRLPGSDHGNEGLQAGSAYAARVEDGTDLDETTVGSADQEQATAPQIGPPEPYDEERNKRWLAGQGMLRLKEFTTAHGTNETAWPPGSGQIIVTEYARRVLQLRQQKQRTFIMNISLAQGTNSLVKDLVAREIERQS